MGLKCALSNKRHIAKQSSMTALELAVLSGCVERATRMLNVCLMMPMLVKSVSSEHATRSPGMEKGHRAMQISRVHIFSSVPARIRSARLHEQSDPMGTRVASSQPFRCQHTACQG